MNSRTNPYSQFFYVNRRMVRDKVITSAVRQAYRNAMPASAYPVTIVFVELPSQEVDVNAHPAKTEIRFRQQGVVHDLIRDSIQHALVESKSIPVYEHRGDVAGLGRGVKFLWRRFSASGGSHNSVFDFTPPSAAADPFQRALNYPFREFQSPPATARTSTAL